MDSRDKGAMLRGELDINDSLMAYLAYGTSKTDYRYNGSISAQILNPAGDFTTVIGQLAFNIKKQSADAGLRGSFRTGAVGHQWAANVTHYQHTQNDYGRRSVPGWDWTTNLYNPVWGPAAPFVAPHISHTELRLDSLGVADTLAFADDRVQLTLGIRRQQVVSETFNVASGARTSRYDESATTPAAALLLKATDTISSTPTTSKALAGRHRADDRRQCRRCVRTVPHQAEGAGREAGPGTFAHTFSVYEIKRPSSYTDPVTNIFSFGGEQRNRGVEWGFFGAPLDGVRLLGGVAYVQPKLTRTAGGVNEGRIATAVAQRQAKLGVEWDVPTLQGLTLTGTATAMSKQYISADNRLSVPGRTLFDVGARYSTTVAGRSLALRASVNNVTNKSYWGMPLLSSRRWVHRGRCWCRQRWISKLAWNPVEPSIGSALQVVRQSANGSHAWRGSTCHSGCRR